MSLYSFSRRALPYTSVAVVLALIYTGWVLWSRSERNQAIEQAASKRTGEADRKIVTDYGNGRLKILAVYPSPAVVHAGEKALLCYGVSNAQELRITAEPKSSAPEGGVWPSLSRCVDIHPKVTSTYTLTAKDAAGTTASQTTTIKVE